MNPAQIAERVRERCPDTIVAREEVTAVVAREALLETLGWLRDDPDLSFGFLSSLTATDWPGKDPRFWLAYELRSIEHLHRLRVKVGLAEGDATMPTVTPMFPTANWHEREVYDFFGIAFRGHPDLRRILMPETYVGWPQRRDFPVGGEPVIFTHNEHEVPRWWE